jgi:hypothetical protein
MIKHICAGIILTTVAFAQGSQPTPAPNSTPAKPQVYSDLSVKSVSIEVENKILKAEHELDAAKHQVDSAQLSQQQAENAYLQLQKSYGDAQKASSEGQKAALDAQKNLDAAIEQGWKESKLSKDEYTFDPANFTFSKKQAAPPSPAKSPEVKK